jgi:hypothetical protein
MVAKCAKTKLARFKVKTPSKKINILALKKIQIDDIKKWR